MLDRPADPADVNRVLLDHRHAIALLRQQIGGGQPGRTRADDGDVGAGRAAFRTRGFGHADYSPQANSCSLPLWPIMDKKRRSEENTSELQSLMRTSYAVFCL